jgi:dTDP-4-dehydrorhamnose reductase
MKILVTGSSGQLGTDVVEILRGTHDVLARKRTDLDIADPIAVEKVVESFTPAIVVNCAAYTRVDDCEEQRQLAFTANVTGPKNLALCVSSYGGKLIHISTDYVFDGNRTAPNPYVEEDEPAPVSYYGQTKLEGERVIRELTEHCIIVRTAWLYGAAGRNFLKTILRLTIQDPKKKLKVVNDQFGSLTWSCRLGQQIARLIEIDGQGIYHATAGGYSSWYDVAATFLKQIGLPHNVHPCTSAEYPTRAVRPRNSILENRRLKREEIHCMRPWQEDLEEFIALYRERLLREAKGE